VRTAASAAAPAASVIVPAFESAATIRRSLGSLRRQTFPEPFEVIVAWSGADATPAIVAAEFPETVLVGRRGRMSTGAARNLGLAVARGEIIAFLAADCEAAPDWLELRVAAHREGHDLVGGAVVWAEPANGLARASHLLEYNSCLPGRPREVSASPVYNLSFRREVYERCGVYDPALPCGEDTALVWRLVEARERFLYDPAIRIAHPGTRGLAGFWRHQEWHGYWLGRLSRRRQVPGIDDATAYRYVRLVVLYPAVRLVRLYRRIWRWQRSWMAQAIALAPLLALGIAAATAGLLRGLAVHSDGESDAAIAEAPVLTPRREAMRPGGLDAPGAVREAETAE
jgi:glycosyltransferase involved in cell wall biosynthesis